MKCPNCKTEVSAGKSMCPICGHFFDDGSQEGLMRKTQTENKTTVAKSPIGKILLIVLAVVIVLFAGIGLGSVFSGEDTVDATPTPSPTPSPNPIYLAELAPINTAPKDVVYYLHTDKDGLLQDAERNNYKYGITLDCGKLAEMMAQFDLKGKYTEFSFYYGTRRACEETDYSRTKNVILVFYYTDGSSKTEELPERSFNTPTSFFSFDVTGVETLEICYPATKGHNDLAELFDARLS